MSILERFNKLREQTQDDDDIHEDLKNIINLTRICRKRVNLMKPYMYELEYRILKMNALKKKSKKIDICLMSDDDLDAGDAKISTSTKEQEILQKYVGNPDPYFSKLLNIYKRCYKRLSDLKPKDIKSININLVKEIVNEQFILLYLEKYTKHQLKKLSMLYSDKDINQQLESDALMDSDDFSILQVNVQSIAFWNVACKALLASIYGKRFLFQLILSCCEELNLSRNTLTKKLQSKFG